ncbi:MAG: glycosyltransferase family 39 protein [Smithella sp.]|nr:glycosyltransferase family 39 protein [Smithella sp.]
MQNNHWLNNKINQFSDYLLLTGILVICLLYRFFYFGYLHPGMVLYNSDSVSYFVFVDICKGIVDLYRTPLYPYIIKFFQYASGENLVSHLIVFQQAISFLSIIPFYFVSQSVIKDKSIAVIATLFYGLWHPVLIQNVHLNPEFLCFAGSILLLWILVKYLEKPGKMKALSLGILPFFLIMLKPTYLMLIFVVFLFFVLRLVVVREEKKIVYWGLVGLLVSSAGVLGYCEMNKKHNGQFVLSNIALNNTLFHISYSGAYRDGGDPELIAIIDAKRHLDYYTVPFTINNDFTDRYQNYNKRFPQYLPPTKDMLFCLNFPDTENFAPERIKRFIHQSRWTTVYVRYMAQRLFDIVVGAYGTLFILFFLQTAVIIFVFFRYGQIAWVQGFCLLFILGQFFSIWLAGLDDMDRHLIPSYPLIMQVTASFLAVITAFLKKEKIEKMVV